MGILDRIMRRAASDDRLAPAVRRSSPSTSEVTATLFTGRQTLEVVGESHYQQHLWRLVGGKQDGVRHPVVAVLLPEPSNKYDANAIQVQIDGGVVGYLGRDDAADYVDRVNEIMRATGQAVALEGTVVGGSSNMLGVFLRHDPSDFLTGSEATKGSALSWYEELPDGDRPAIAKLRELLAVELDALSRHFQFNELESRLYRSRDLYDEALAEYDEVCGQHDAEMDAICAAFVEAWSEIPQLPTYRQMAIRHQKAKDWEAVLRWVERGLALYGTKAARQDAVEDLEKRRNRALAKLGNDR